MNENTNAPHPLFATTHTHGGGDTMAAAVAAALARGCPVPEAVAFGKRVVTEGVRHAYPLGAGHGPVSPLWAVPPWWEDRTAPSTGG